MNVRRPYPHIGVVKGFATPRHDPIPVPELGVGLHEQEDVRIRTECAQRTLELASEKPIVRNLKPFVGSGFFGLGRIGIDHRAVIRRRRGGDNGVRRVVFSFPTDDEKVNFHTAEITCTGEPYMVIDRKNGWVYMEDSDLKLFIETIEHKLLLLHSKSSYDQETCFENNQIIYGLNLSTRFKKIKNKLIDML